MSTTTILMQQVPLTSVSEQQPLEQGQPISWGILANNNSNSDPSDPVMKSDLTRTTSTNSLLGITTPLYASAGSGIIPGDLVDLNEIFADDFLLPGMDMLQDDISTNYDHVLTDNNDEVVGLSTNADINSNSSSSTEVKNGRGKGSGLPSLYQSRGNVGSVLTRNINSRRSTLPTGIAARLGTRLIKPPTKYQEEEEEEEDDEDDDDEEDDEDDDEEEGLEQEGVDGYPSRKRKKAAKLTVKPLTEQQRVERRERNREHAKRSRMRKKFMLESLQAQMLALRKENLRLRQLVATKLPDKAEQILRSCSSSKSVSIMSPVELGHHRALADSDGRLISALQFSQQNFTVSDPSLPDNPIVYASQGFLDLTGYSSDQIIGRNCRFLQGPGTDPAAVDIIRRGVALGEDTSVCLLNYRADGTPFWNQFFVAALRDAEGNIVNYVGVQCKVDEAPMEEELKERVKTINFEED